jgi:hypothetical protein
MKRRCRKKAAKYSKKAHIPESRSHEYYTFRIAYYEKNCNECKHKRMERGYHSDIIVCGKRNKPMYELLKSLFLQNEKPFCHLAERLTTDQKKEMNDPDMNPRNNGRPIIKVLEKRYILDDWIKKRECYEIYL